MSTSEELVKVVYNLLLGRDPEPAGLRHWSSALNNGLTQIEFVRSTLSSKECRNYIGFDGFESFKDVDLIIPLETMVLRVPASDHSLVPHLLKERTWEPHIGNYFKQNLKKSDILVDIGANLGYFIALCAPLVSRVFAFEPVMKTYKYCSLNIELNKLNNVILYNMGIWNKRCESEITVDESDLMSAHLGQGEKIKCVALDDLDLSPTMIKMDIEGAEPFALEGMQKTIEIHRPKIIMECNRPAMMRFGNDMKDVWNFFKSVGYNIYAFHQWEEVPPELVDYAELIKLCPQDGLIDILAM